MMENEEKHYNPHARTQYKYRGYLLPGEDFPGEFNERKTDKSASASRYFKLQKNLRNFDNNEP